MSENTYTFERNWSGYSRGVDRVDVTAETLEEAKLLVDQECVWYERQVIRDDTECEDWEHEANL